MPKSNIHPIWNKNIQITCDRKPLCLIDSTKKKLQIDIWLANHPFYTNSQVVIDTDGHIERFMKKYQFALSK